MAAKKKKDLKEEVVTPLSYVGIGASAGGLEALQNLVRHIPVTSNHVYIVIQHLSPDFKSMMSELLARHTDLPIKHITDDVKLQANHIYLAPPRKYVLVAEGKAMLVDQMEGEDVMYPIDVFFRSLAKNKLHQSVAVVLSGTGSDGSRGILAVKEEGGLVVVQEPTDAGFNGMPVNAIKSGCVDLVLNATDIADKIMQYTNHPVVAGATLELPDEEKTDARLKEIYGLLNNHSNIDFNHYKVNTVKRRVQRRLAISGLENLTEYYTFLLNNPKELQTLAQDMLIGVTRFFRDTAAFEIIEQKVIPEIIEQSSDDAVIRVWSACCSTGEEAYSLAILIDEQLKLQRVSRTVRIFATDVDVSAITDAGLGQYPPNISTDVSNERLENYFIKNDSGYTVAPHIRQMVVFAQHNLLQDPPFSNCQLSICRNALIYFEQEAQKRVLTMLHFSLNRAGYLFLGSSETLGDMNAYFEPVDERNRIYRKMGDAKLVVQPMRPKQVAAKTSEHNGQGHLESVGAPALHGRAKHTNQKLPHYIAVLEQMIDEYAPPAIVLSEQLEVLHVMGDISPFTQKLKPGRFTANLSDFILDGLSVAVATATYRAKSACQHVSYKGIRFNAEGSDEVQEVSLRVLYLDGTKLTSNYMVVLFEPHVQSLVDIESGDNVIQQDGSRQLIADLEDALRQKQEDLQVTIEELQTTNEELQSSNEELMAANEELQSTNEELESVNEELYSVNTEYQEKIETISQLNTDMSNVITSGNISFIFLDDALIIRRFSMQATKDIHLMPTDIGRPIHHISHQLVYENFIKDIASVIKNEHPMEVKVMNETGEEKLVRISPYVNENNQNYGCVIGITDISHVQVLQANLTESWRALRSTLSASLLNTKALTNILVVDDESVDRKQVISALEKASIDNSQYKITEAATFEEAQQQLKENSFDICILDFHLNSHEGFELINGLTKINSGLAFILLSGSINDKVRKDAIKYGVYDVIDKEDLSPALIQRSVRYTLSHQRTERFLLEQDQLDLH